MKWLTLAMIKQQVKVLHTYEDDMLILYGESAEETILDWTGRTYEELVQMGGGTFPKRLEQASLMLCDLSYNHRSPVTMANLNVVPYGNLDVLVKPFMKL